MGTGEEMRRKMEKRLKEVVVVVLIIVIVFWSPEQDFKVVTEMLVSCRWLGLLKWRETGVKVSLWISLR